MPDDRQPVTLDVVTAIMLGLVAFVTALGAWQAGAWDAGADELARDAGDARDVSFNQSVLADFSARTDLEASNTARAFAAQRDEEPDLVTQLLLDNKIQAALTGTTPGFTDAWFAWQTGGFDPDTLAVDDAEYVVARDGTYRSYGEVGRVLDDMSHVLQNRSGVLAQATLIQALALFLLGVAGVNRARGVRVGILALGSAVFVGGIALALSAYGVGL